MVAVLAATGLTFSGTTALAQGSPAATTAPLAVAATPAPHLSVGELKVLQLVQAKVGEGTIIAYINNSWNNYYALNAEQIIYLHQQGVSDAILTAMLNQSRSGLTMSEPSPVAYGQSAPDTTA